MCGIFGLFLPDKDAFPRERLGMAVDRLFLLSESRGKEAAGLAVLRPGFGAAAIHRRPMAASLMIRSSDYTTFFQREIPADGPLAIIGHSRLVTHGSQERSENNQPVIRDGLCAVHNGIIINADLLWAAQPGVERTSEVDTEIALALYRLIREAGSESAETDAATPADHAGRAARAASDMLVKLSGSVSLALLDERRREAVLATNTGSLYTAYLGQGPEGQSGPEGGVIFSSEGYILGQVAALFRKWGLVCGVPDRVSPGKGLALSLAPESAWASAPISFDYRTIRRERHSGDEAGGGQAPAFIEVLRRRYARFVPPSTEGLRRCTRCILPETMPFIEFDDQGVCNFCHNHLPMEVRGRQELSELVAPHRSGGKKPDCLVLFSGGRDSSFGLHVICEELGMTPLAFTYDWGALTDLGRRNQARMCGRLGVEHLLVSADIARKRIHVKKNLLAWLKKPELGMVPLLMAGDKQYFYFANMIKNRYKLPLALVCENPLESTRFKSGFCGVKEKQSRPYDLSAWSQLQLLFYYFKNYVNNPSYFNISIADNITAFWSYYICRHDYIHLFKYIHWDEKKVDSTLYDAYAWELDPETPTSWRIGDGTAAFYNYIYYTLAGLTENDTLRSNQIREGVLGREEALAMVERENYPRFGSMEWYASIIGFDLEEALEVVSAARKVPGRI